MSSISAGTTLTTALVATGDTSGELLFKTGPSATTAVTVDTSQNVVVVGILTAKGLTYPTVDGTSGQAIVTNGAGTLSFTSITGGAQGFVTMAIGPSTAPGEYSDAFTLI
jgi:hypothetical protein